MRSTTRTQVSSSEISRTDAVLFLNRATYGASESSIAEVQSIGNYSDWVDAQFELPISLTEPYVRATSNGSLGTTRHHIWWQNLVEEPDQLRQRMAFAWSQLFVVSDIDYILSNSQYGMTGFYDMLAAESDGNFRTLLERVTLHPVMGVYLSMVRNEKADPARNVRPDENFAREILQLFTIGLYELELNGEEKQQDGNPVPTYNQAAVEEFAKVFTGWDYADSRSWTSNQAHDRTLTMVPNEEFHDTSAKTLLNGVTLPAGGTAEEDLEGALDNIFEHPNVGPFIAKSLIKRLVTSNPSPEYVARVASVFNDDGTGERGNLAALTKAILVDDEAINGHRNNPQTFGKIKEPLLRITQVWRAFGAVPGSDSDGIYRTPEGGLSQIDNSIGQEVMSSPSVFNFYSPDNPLDIDSELVSPEKQILSEVNLASTNNLIFRQIYRNNNADEDVQANQTLINISPQIALADDPEALLGSLEELLLGESLPADYRSALLQQISSLPTTDVGPRDRALDAIFGIVGSPFHYVQK